MKRYVFLPTQGLNFRPNFESPVPDFIDIEEDYVGQSVNMEEALKDMLGIVDLSGQDKWQETFRLDLRNDHRRFFALKDYKNRIGRAS